MSTFIESARRYFLETDLSESEVWIFCIAFFLLILILSKILLTFLSPTPKKTDWRPQRKYFIRYSFLLSGILTSAVFCAFILIFWSQNKYQEWTYEFLHIILLVSGLSISLYQLIRLRLSSGREHDEYFSFPVSKQEKERSIIVARRRFNRLKALFLIPFIPFLLLFFPFHNPGLVNIILDTSNSMGFQNALGEIPIQTGIASLNEIFVKLDERNDIVITHFLENPNTTKKGSLEEIIQVGNHAMLNANSIFFRGTEKASVTNFVNSLEDNLTSNTPLCESIWANYLFLMDIETERYSSLVTIIITDGIGNINTPLDNFLCENSALDKIYSNPEYVQVVNLGEDRDSPFFDLTSNCGYELYEGNNASSYNFALNDILNEFKQDWIFIFCLLFVNSLFFLISLLVFPD